MKTDRDTAVSLSMRTQSNFPFNLTGEAPRNASARKAVQSVALSAVHAAQTDTPSVGYSRSKAHYNQAALAGDLYTYPHVVGSVDYLASNNAIGSDVAKQGTRGRCSTLTATPELIAAYWDSQPDVSYREPPEVQLRDADKLPAQLPNTRATLRMQRQIARFREMANSISVTHPAARMIAGRQVIEWLHPANKEPVSTEWNPQQVCLTRIFNLNPKHGGRLYFASQSIQGIPSHLRTDLLINGDPTVEIDYANLHPLLLYAEQKFLLLGDAYGGGTDRPKFKLAWNIGLNADTTQKATRALAKDLAQSCGRVYPERSDLELATLLLDIIARKHHPIADSFGSGAGLRLQNTDSDLAAKVVAGLVSNGIDVLPVHDSFVVKSGQETALKTAMDTALSSKLRGLKFGVVFPDKTNSYAESALHSGTGAVGRVVSVRPSAVQLDLFPDSVGRGVLGAQSESRGFLKFTIAAIGVDGVAHFLGKSTHHVTKMKNSKAKITETTIQQISRLHDALKMATITAARTSAVPGASGSPRRPPTAELRRDMEPRTHLAAKPRR